MDHEATDADGTRKRQRQSGGGDSDTLAPSAEEADATARLERTPTISFNALRRARTTIEDFVKTYFFYHDLHIPNDLFKYFDILVYTEATIYQMDEHNESLCTAQTPPQDGEEVPYTSELLGILDKHVKLDGRLEAELRKGLRYWREERRLCHLMVSCVPIPRHRASGSDAPFSAAEVHACSLSKSFDYRVLNLILFRLTDKEYDEALLEFLQVDEHLVDINDDLVDYEEDIFANSFNIFRAYIHLFGQEAQLELVKRISDFEKRREELLTRLPGHIQGWVRSRDAEAVEDAGEGSEKWIFPSPIFDEAHYKALYQES